MNSSKTFPPGAGWIPLVVALVVVFLAATLSLTPQFDKQVSLGNGAGAARKGVTKTITDKNGNKVQVQVDPSTGQIISGPGGTDFTSGGDAGSLGSGGDLGSSGTDGSTGTSTSSTDGTTSSSTSGGSSGSGGGGGGLSGGGSVACDSAHNGGATAPGVSASQINVATTIVNTGVGADFLGDAVYGIKAAIAEANHAGGICGRQVVLAKADNSGWNGPTGASYINNYIQGNNIFALVGEPDSEGLSAAIDSGAIDQAGMPVVGTDGMLKNQYHDPWVWPVAASTVTNAHIIASYAYQHQGARKFGIVYDNKYKFGAEGAQAFKNEISRLPGASVGSTCSDGFCGINGDQQGGYSTQVASFNQYCGPCDAVFMLLEPGPMTTWMSEEYGTWFKNLYGGEPLFDTKLANNCGGCAKGQMKVWTGYYPALQPFSGQQPAVQQYMSSLHAINPGADPQNEFTEGAYLGTKLFIEACKRLGAANVPLTRDNLKSMLNTGSYDLGLSTPLTFVSDHLANTKMAMFAATYSGKFSGWAYQNTDYVDDPARGKEQ